MSLHQRNNPLLQRMSLTSVQQVHQLRQMPLIHQQHLLQQIHNDEQSLANNLRSTAGVIFVFLINSYKFAIKRYFWRIIDI